MTNAARAPAGDQVKVSVLVEVEPPEAFRVFTEEIDLWWRRGLKYRVFRSDRGVIHLEPKLDGRLFESFDDSGQSRVVETGRITTWDPPHRFVLIWRAMNFTPSEQTEVEVTFSPSPSGTLVTVVHRGWSSIRADHPVRHGDDVQRFIGSMAMWWGGLMASLREHVVRPR